MELARALSTRFWDLSSLEKEPFLAEMKNRLAICKNRREELWLRLKDYILIMIFCPNDQETLVQLSHCSKSVHILEQDIRVYILWILLVQEYVDKRQAYRDSARRIMGYERELNL
jgi:hypothetical protein